MTGRQRRETERNIRSHDLLTTNAADFAANAVATAMIGKLTLKVGKVQQEFQRQLAGDGKVKQDYDFVKDYYDALRDEMVEVRDFARTISRKKPHFEDLFRVPRGSGRRALVAAARVFVQNAQENKDDFISYGMDADFISVLEARADALETALNDAAESVGERVGATDTLALDVEEASDIVEDVDPIVRRTYRNNPAKLAAWEFASRVERHTPVPRTPPTK